MSNIIPAILKKRITFRRLPLRNCEAYEIYGNFKDSKYASGIRTELIERLENPDIPSPVKTSIKLEKVKHP